MTPVHAGLARDEIALAQIDAPVTGPLVVEPAGTHDRVGVPRDAQQSFGAPLPLDETVVARTRRTTRVHGSHETDVGPAVPQRLQQRRDGGVETDSTLTVHIAAVGQDHRVDIRDEWPQVVGGRGGGLDDLDPVRKRLPRPGCVAGLGADGEATFDGLLDDDPTDLARGTDDQNSGHGMAPSVGTCCREPMRGEQDHRSARFPGVRRGN